MITSLHLQHFRSYTDASFEFSDQVNIIVGPNASGKTNLLEGLLYAADARAFRSADQENIQHGQSWARIDATTEKNQVRTIKLETTSEKTKKTIELDGTLRGRLPQVDRLPTVLFEPDHLQFLTTSPSKRREFIDTLIDQIDPSYSKLKRDYTRALTQRNRLLKQNKTQITQEIFPWNVRLSELGGMIVEKRRSIIDAMQKNFNESYHRIANGTKQLHIAYTTKLPENSYASSMLKKLESDLELDRARGFTGAGPHRDDTEITIDKVIMQSVASRGETRTILLALKMQETLLLEAFTNKKPLLLLDDVFSELDGKRRKALTNFIGGFQSFITTTDADVVGKSYSQKANLISLK